MASNSDRKRNYSDMNAILEFMLNDDSDMECDLGGTSTDPEDLDSEWEYESDNCTDNNPTSNLPREAPSNELEAPILGYLDTDPPSEEDIPPPNFLFIVVYIIFSCFSSSFDWLFSSEF